ncbi:hypothetical protein GF389_00605 [Candidatus Dojkabacteria bacterium]|nr:hypothetical protein [Candidatus Dojkabacteria bacterium]
MRALDKLKKGTTNKILVKNYDISVVREFLDFLGKPDEGMTIFHVGGTSGKGSTATLLASVLTAHDLKAGLFVSPHVESVCERIQIDDEIIGIDELEMHLEKIFYEYDKFVSGKDLRNLTYFELLFVAAVLHFRENNVKHAVIEVGLGGKLDPTNVLHGDYCILTNVGLDHQRVLGDTVEEIARDKVQIVKNGARFVTGVDQPSVKEVVKDWVDCRVDGVVLWQSEEFDVRGVEVELGRTRFDYESDTVKFQKLVTNLTGTHQAINAGLAISSFLQFARDEDLNWSKDLINKGLKLKDFPGRFEVKSRQPLIIWDGAHNGDKMKALFDTLSKVKEDLKLKILLAVKNDKDFDAVIEAISSEQSSIQQIVLTDYKVRQDVVAVSANASELKSRLEEKLGKEVEVVCVHNPEFAYKKVIENFEKDEMVLVCGSFYLLDAISK